MRQVLASFGFLFLSSGCLPASLSVELGPTSDAELEDDDDAADDDDMPAPQPQVFCGPIQELGPDATGSYYSGEAQARADDPTTDRWVWNGCEVERFYDAGVLECEAVWEVFGEIAGADDGGNVVWQMTYRYDLDQSTCGPDGGSDYANIVLTSFDGRGGVLLAVADQWQGANTDWEVFARTQYTVDEATQDVSFEYTTEFDGGP